MGNIYLVGMEQQGTTDFRTGNKREVFPGKKKHRNEQEKKVYLYVEPTHTYVKLKNQDDQLEEK